MKINVTIDTSEWNPGDADILRSFADILDKKRDTALNSDAPTTETIITQDANEYQYTNVHHAQEVQDMQGQQYEQFHLNIDEDSVTMEGALHELGLKLSGDASANRIACKETVKKWFSILGHSDFKKAIGAIHEAWPKGYHGLQWNQMIVKDVCFFVYYFHKHGYVIDFDLLSLSLSHKARGERIIAPMEMRKYITQDNAGDTTLARYNAYLGNLREQKFPEINKSERRSICNAES